jgi:hypothetical protein
MKAEDPMNSNEALQRINEIHKVIESSNKAIFSGERMIVTGVLVTLIPLIEIATQYLTFGHEFGEKDGLYIALIHTIFYWALFKAVGKLSPYKKAAPYEQHPLIEKAFSLGRPFFVSIMGVVFVLSFTEQYQLIHPIVFILLGLLFNLYGRFTVKAVTMIAWSYIFLGFIYALLNKQHIPHLWIYMTIYNGLSYIAMGIFLRKEKATV